MNAFVSVLAPAPPRRARSVPWRVRILDAFSTYLPLLLMALLALGSWWLVKNTPTLDAQQTLAPPRHEADYEMSNFVVQRFAADGSLQVHIEGTRMQHYPDTNTLEITDARIRAMASDGRLTHAKALQAVANGDASEVQLKGGARVTREGGVGEPPTEFQGEFLHFFRNTERVRSHLPVTVTRGSSEFRADAFEYDNLRRVIELKGRVRAVFVPPTAVARAVKP